MNLERLPFTVSYILFNYQPFLGPALCNFVCKAHCSLFAGQLSAVKTTNIAD